MANKPTQSENKDRPGQRLITICAHCKRMRADGDQWQEVDPDFLRTVQTKISHGLCPSCFNEWYADCQL